MGEERVVGATGGALEFGLGSESHRHVDVHRIAGTRGQYTRGRDGDKYVSYKRCKRCEKTAREKSKEEEEEEERTKARTV